MGKRKLIDIQRRSGDYGFGIYHSGGGGNERCSECYKCGGYHGSGHREGCGLEEAVMVFHREW